MSLEKEKKTPEQKSEEKPEDDSLIFDLERQRKTIANDLEKFARELEEAMQGIQKKH